MTLLWVAYGVAVAAWLVLAVRTARRYSAIPPRFPISTDMAGNPVLWGPRAVAWLVPGILAALIAMLGLGLTHRPPPTGERVVLTLVMLVVAEIAPLMMWNLDRQIEVARGERARIEPRDSLRAAAPILASVLVIFAVAAVASR